MKAIFVLLGLLAVSGLADAATNLKLHGYFSEGAVLRRAPARSKIFGWTTAYTNKVYVNIAGQNKDTRPDVNGYWEVKLDPIAGSGPTETLTLTVQADSNDPLVVNNLVAGEVFMATGQSNMMYPLAVMFNSSTDIADAVANNYYNLHIMNAASFAPYMSNCVATEQDDILPLDGSTSFSWTTKDSAMMLSRTTNFGALAFYIGREMSKYYGGNVHVGVYENAVPGTRIESWIRKSVRTGCGAVIDPPPSPPSANPIPKNESCLFNGLIAPVKNIEFTAIAYYQGEGNWQNPDEYECLFPALIDSWRNNVFSKPNMPFFFFQLAPYPGGPTQPAFTLTRVAQNAALGKSKTDMIRSGDLGDIGGPGGGLHPRIKWPLAKRFVLSYSKKVDGVDVITDGPNIKKIKVESLTPASVVLSFKFKTTDSGVTLQNVPVCVACNNNFLFQYQLANGTFAWLDQSRIFDTSSDDDTFYLGYILTPGEGAPLAINYPWSETPQRRIMSGAGLPANPFNLPVTM